MAVLHLNMLHLLLLEINEAVAQPKKHLLNPNNKRINFCLMIKINFFKIIQKI